MRGKISGRSEKINANSVISFKKLKTKIQRPKQLQIIKNYFV